MIRPEWPAPANVRALVTTRDFGDVANPEIRAKLRALLPAEPFWLRQVHGTVIAEIDSEPPAEADAAISRKPESVCAVFIADCMPVLYSDEAGSVVGIAHAGWRGLCAGVLEKTLEAMQIPPANVLAWLGPAIGPRVYEVGEDVRAAFAGYEFAFTPSRAGHWLLDLYAVARTRLERQGVRRIYGGGFCTYTDERFFSYRRERTNARMAALIWLT